MSVVIELERVGKKYSISSRRSERYSSLRETIMARARSVFSSSSSHEGGAVPFKDFWALQDITLRIEAGERVGIIGRNGAGKSTLLKLLSRITEPSTGRIKLKGRVASLLEVGTGFHPELTGRENIFLNGAILGMARAEIYQKFDEIVAFAEVDAFLDTPVKRYSSGMYVRLAFSVAAHLEPEILIVDEVLAVGDAAFQRKCLGKMDDVSKSGRTLLFVSHNMAAIGALCNRAILLNHGKVVASGDTSAVLKAYGETYHEETDLAHRIDRSGSGDAKITKMHAQLLDGRNLNGVAEVNTPFSILVKIDASPAAAGKSVAVVLFICDRNDNRLCSTHTDWSGSSYLLAPGINYFRCDLPNGLPFVADQYFVGGGVVVGGVTADKIQRALELELVSTLQEQERFIPSSNFGPFLIEHNWVGPRSSS